MADVPQIHSLGDRDWIDIVQGIRQLEVSPNDDVGASAMFFPIAVIISDSLHVFYNALQQAIESVPAWQTLGPILHDLARFLGD
eukprot:1422301-Pyramimonas_sp.AAC.1